MRQIELVVPHSAKQVAKIQKRYEQIKAADLQHKNKLEKGADSSIEQKELIKNQVDLLYEQNRLLSDNYDKLKEIYDAQCQSTIEAKEDLRKSRRYNAWMMVVSIVSMLAAVFSALLALFN